MASAEVVSLGGLVFDETNFEVPEDLELGKTTLGGSVEIPQTDGTPATKASQTLGVVTDPIKFQAWFIGPNAEQNAELLEAAQAAQDVTTFQRGARTYDVIIMRVSLKYRNANEINYDVELEALAETSASDATSQPSTPTAISDDSQAIASILAQSPTDTRLDDSNESAQNVLDSLDAMGSDYSGVAIQSSGILVAVLAAIDLLEALMGSLAGSTLSADVSTYLYAASLLGGLSQLSADLGTQTGDGTPSIQTGGSSLYELAVRYTGDITNADAIAAVNNITDPFNLPPTIVLPSF